MGARSTSEDVVSHRMTFPCPQCGRQIGADPDMAGMQTTCPACGQEASIPAGGDMPDPVTSPPHGSAAGTDRMRADRFECPKCHSPIQVHHAKLGASVQCPVCSLVFLAPKRRPSALERLLSLGRSRVPVVLAALGAITVALWLARRIPSGEASRGLQQAAERRIGANQPLFGASRGRTRTSPGAISASPFWQSPSHGGSESRVVGSIMGTWLVDPSRCGSLGASELLARPVGDTNVPQMTLVISGTTILHRYRKDRMTPFELVSPRADIKTSRDHSGVRYEAIEYSYYVVPNTSPHRIDLQFAGPLGQQSSYGIFRLQQGPLWFCFPAVTGDSRRPRAWDTDAGATRVIRATRVD